MLTHQNEEKGPFLARSQRAFQKLRFLFPAVLRDLKSLDLLSLEYSLFSSNMEAHHRRAYTNHGTIINILISIYPQFQLFGFVVFKEKTPSVYLFSNKSFPDDPQ